MSKKKKNKMMMMMTIITAKMINMSDKDGVTSHESNKWDKVT